MGGMMQWPASPWTLERQGRVGFALQVFPVDTPADPGRQLLAAARMAEALDFDAFFVGDHPAWQLDPWVHLAAIAVTTRRIRLGSACRLRSVPPPGHDGTAGGGYRQPVRWPAGPGSRNRLGRERVRQPRPPVSVTGPAARGAGRDHRDLAWRLG